MPVKLLQGAFMLSDHSTSLAENPQWRANWFVANWFTALPFVGGFFKTSDRRESVKHVFHYSFMLAGGAVFMALDIFPSAMHTSDLERRLLMTSKMAVGMALGEMSFNTLFSATQLVVKTATAAKAAMRSAADDGAQMPLLG